MSIINEHNIRFDENLSVSEDVLFNLEYGKFCDNFSVVNLSLYNHRVFLNNESEHLDGKLPSEMFYMNRSIYRARSGFVVQEHRLEFETASFYSFIGDIKSIANNNSFDKKNKQRKIKEILNSAEFSATMKTADTSKENWKLLLLLKLKLANVVLSLFEKG